MVRSCLGAAWSRPGSQRSIEGGSPHLVVESLTAIFSIIIIDLVLSGDNAVVIGMAARSLSTENRRRAIIFGGAGAIGLRILFTALATVLLGIPLPASHRRSLALLHRVQAPAASGRWTRRYQGSRFVGEAIQTIILADVVMSLDNIGGCRRGARGYPPAHVRPAALDSDHPLRQRARGAAAWSLPGLLVPGAFVLVHAAVAMVLHDATFEDRFHTNMWQELALSLAITAAIIGRAAAGAVEWSAQYQVRRRAPTLQSRVGLGNRLLVARHGRDESGHPPRRKPSREHRPRR